MQDHKIEGHVKYIIDVFGVNTANVFRKLYTDFNFADLAELKSLLEEKKYPLLGKGSTRATYAISKTHVVKIPTGSNDWQWAEIKASLTELIIYKKAKKLKIFVETELYFYKSIPVLLSRRVTPAKYGEINQTTPEFLTKFANLSDGRHQLGKNSRGELRCFDFGLEDHMVDHKKRDISKRHMTILKNKPKDISPFLFPSELLPLS